MTKINVHTMCMVAHAKWIRIYYTFFFLKYELPLQWRFEKLYVCSLMIACRMFVPSLLVVIFLQARIILYSTKIISFEFNLNLHKPIMSSAMLDTVENFVYMWILLFCCVMYFCVSMLISQQVQLGLYVLLLRYGTIKHCFTPMIRFL